MLASILSPFLCAIYYGPYSMFHIEYKEKRVELLWAIYLNIYLLLTVQVKLTVK